MMKFNLALCQMNVEEDKKANIKKAESMICASAKNGADFVILPEMFNCPYDNSEFKEYSEDINGETVSRISNVAKENGVYVVAGSIPERQEKQLYNTSFIFNRKGEVIGKHRKMHLFNINISGKIQFRESDTLSAGNAITVVDTEFCKIGIAICYDIRFPELLRMMALEEAKLIIIPAAFNMITGPAHWEEVIRVRAIDNQVFMAACSPARNEKSTYVAYGHSMLVDPWGTILEKAGVGEEIIYGCVDLEQIEKVRNRLPLLQNRRTDIYEIKRNNL